jgi:hypothetical protein
MTNAPPQNRLLHMLNHRQPIHPRSELAPPQFHSTPNGVRPVVCGNSHENPDLLQRNHASVNPVLPLPPINPPTDFRQLRFRSAPGQDPRPEIIVVRRQHTDLHLPRPSYAWTNLVQPDQPINPAPQTRQLRFRSASNDDPRPDVYVIRRRNSEIHQRISVTTSLLQPPQPIDPPAEVDQLQSHSAPGSEPRPDLLVVPGTSPIVARSNSNILESPVDVGPFAWVRQRHFDPGFENVNLPEIVVTPRLPGILNPNAKIFVPSRLRSPPLIASPWHTPGTPGSMPSLTPDHSPVSADAPRRVLNYAVEPEPTFELTPEHIEAIKAELIRAPPILVPSEHKKRSSPGLFLHGTAPPGLTRHTAVDPYHPSGIANLPLPPVTFVGDPAEDYTRFHSVKMIQGGRLKNTTYLHNVGELFWKCNWERTWGMFISPRDIDPFSLGNPTCIQPV